MGAQTPALLSAAHFTIFLEVMIMIQNTISQYIRTLFDESRDGELLAGDADNQFDYPVEWDEETANTLAQECGRLVGHLTELSRQFEKLCQETRHLTQEQMEAWNTYLLRYCGDRCRSCGH